MKSKKILILLACSLTALTGCVNKGTGSTKVNLLYGNIREANITNITELDELEYDELSSLIAHKENFILATFNPTCGCWDDYQKPLTYFINKYHYDIKYMDINKLSGKDEKYGIYSVAGDLPGIVFFKNGKITKQAKYYGNPKPNIFKKNEDFEQFVLQNVNLPKMYYVTKTVLDGYITDNKEFILYASLTNCPDCATLEEKYLKDWNNKVNTINAEVYVFDILPYLIAGQSQEIRDELGLSATSNPTFGWETGYVPTFQRRVGSSITDMITVINDRVEDGKIVSYFSSERVNASPSLRGNASKYIVNGRDHAEVTDKPAWRLEEYELQKDAIKTFFDTYIK